MAHKKAKSHAKISVIAQHIADGAWQVKPLTYDTVLWAG